MLAEKSINVEIVDVSGPRLPEDLLDLNPYHSVPTLVDRELVLYDSRVIIEYLDERFPHPPLMPVDPVSRARMRLAMYRVVTDWYSQVVELESGDSKRISKARKLLRERLISSSDVFSYKPYFLNDEFFLVDCAIAPLLWRLPAYGIDLPAQAKAIHAYADRIFSRDSFQASLSDLERDMRN